MFGLFRVQTIEVTCSWTELKCLDNRGVQIIEVWINKVVLCRDIKMLRSSYGNRRLRRS